MSDDSIKTSLASENCHWYTKQGEPAYEVPRAKGDGTRPTTLSDARKLGLVPSVTMILGCAAKPGLEAWKAKQLLEAALTLPRQHGETLDDYAARVIEDSKAQGRKAAERGTELHAAIEEYIRNMSGTKCFCENPIWQPHCEKVAATLKQYGIDILQGKTEHSFASPMGFGGKLDWHNDGVIIDFKTKANLSAKQLAYPEHCWQLAAYESGLTDAQRRIINVFIGIEDCKVRIHEWSSYDQEQGWLAFTYLLKFWHITKNYNGAQQ